MGKLFQELGEAKKAKEQFTKGLEIARQRIIIKKGSDASRGNLAAILLNMGDITMEADRDLEAVLKHYQEALQVREDILLHPSAEFGGPSKPFYVLLYLAEDYFRQAQIIREKMLNPSNARRQAELMLALAAAGDHTRAVEFAVKLSAAKNVDAEMLLDVARAYALCSTAETAGTDERAAYTAQALKTLQQVQERVGAEDILGSRRYPATP